MAVAAMDWVVVVAKDRVVAEAGLAAVATEAVVREAAGLAMVAQVAI